MKYKKRPENAVSFLTVDRISNFSILVNQKYIFLVDECLLNPNSQNDNSPG